ncbi:hypothetical protein [Phascolarctobacterium sp.]
MAKKVFPDPATDIINGLMTGAETVKEENKKTAENIKVKENTKIVEDKALEQKAKEEKGKATKESPKVSNKFVATTIKYPFEVSLRINKVLNELKAADPENSSKYSKVFFIDEAILKSLKEYEEKLGI